MKKILTILGLATLLIGISSCHRDEDLGESIFDTTTPVVDPTATTAPFDQWLYDNFVVPYNTEIQYKFNLPASNMDYRLTPADYKKSQLLAHLIKYLFYEVYIKFAGENFMKQYGPRIFHFIGSTATSPTTGTETKGYASGGVKITLINVNGMKLPDGGAASYSAADIEQLNMNQFHVMHHEFSHILHQTKSYPVAFGQITPGDYDGRNWQDRDSVLAHNLGFTTQYGSSATYEDFVETLSCTITDTDSRWMRTIIDACANGGVKEGDKERIYVLIDSLKIQGLDDPAKAWNNFTICKETAIDPDTEEETERYVPDFHVADARGQNSQADTPKTLKYEDVKTFTSFRDYLDNWVEIDKSGETKGMNSYTQTIMLFEKYLRMLKEHGLRLDTHCVRTWIYVGDIDNNYAGVVR